MPTPLMKQYAKVKSRHQGTILLFRMGDFFETFEEDAKITSRILGITLTKRKTGGAGEVPLAGFPHHALESYLPKLLKAGHRVAICEQLEDPKLARGIVKRDVVEVVTPGVAFSDKILDEKQNNYLASIALPSPLANGNSGVGLAYIDVSTGEFSVSELLLKELPEQLSSIRPSEILLQKRDADGVRRILQRDHSGIYTEIDDWAFNFEYAYELLVTHFRTQSLKGFGAEDMNIGIVAAGAIMNYLQETQKANLRHLQKITPVNVSDYIVLDPSTKRNLEITSQLSGSEDGSLFSVLDMTSTPMGGRLLKKWMNHPLNEVSRIRKRLEAVKEFAGDESLRKDIHGIMSEIGDLERLSAKVCTSRATPREVISLKRILVEVEALIQAMSDVECETLRSARDGLRPLPEVVEMIGKAITDDPPTSLSAGGVIRKGYNPELDELRTIASSGKEWIAALQKEEREKTGIPSLKIGFNNVFGYYIEITHTHRDRVPATYIRKQTLTNAERYITPELKEYEEKVLHAEEKILSLESGLFDQVRSTIAAQTGIIQSDAQLIAALDCYTSLSSVAVDHNYVCPDISDSTGLQISGGRHPVIERYLPPGESYTPNDTLLDTTKNQILIITGPNMSGKSSYLRQTGLIVLLAQMGSFVPAESATIGIVDRIFTRVGASDNIASGESTFLVEMHEAANIVNTATERSLVLLDEVGRGTSTFDGISIAWALTEYLHRNVKARTLFATHYHELNELSELYSGIRNFKVDVREYGDKVVFLHKVVPGFADHSYGIQVAQMAGLPEQVTDRAREILTNLESTALSLHGNTGNRHAEGSERGSGRGLTSGTMQMTMFELKDDRIRNELEKIDIDKLTPLEALQKLAELKAKLDPSK